MRYRTLSTTVFVTFSLLGCANNPGPNEHAGAAGSGGQSSSKGGSSSGGASASGSGGSNASGGAASSGGIVASGGSSSGTAGGAGGSGGGSSGSGGSTTSAGGATAKGGAGGASASGGSSATGPCNDAPTPDGNTCAKWKEWNQCSISYLTDGHYCEQTCGRCGSSSGSSGGSGSAGSNNTGGANNAGGSASKGGASGNGGAVSSGGSSGGGAASGPGSTNPPITGSNGYATRYWDCCKPSCSWTTSVAACQKDGTSRISDRNAQSSCKGGPAYECYDFAPWYDSGTNMSYGFVAHNGVACGTCYMFQFTGEGNSGPNAGATALKGQQMVVQTVNIGGLGSDQFDLLVPGGGVGDFAQGCQSQWGGTGANTVYGGMLSDCKGDCSCMKGKCSSFFGSMPALKAGCDWFTNWYSCADNPKLIYKQISCPSQLTSRSGL